MAASKIKAPFPWFGGKSRSADLVWRHLGDVNNYVEPFFGSGAVLLASPKIHRFETINDLDGYVANFWRAIKSAPDDVAHHADWPVNENDLHARHSWLVEQKKDFVPRLEGDPDFYDAKIAGYWVWGMACWIGGEFCSGKGPWRVVDGKLVKTSGNTGQGVDRQLVHLGNTGRGVNRKLVHLGDTGRGVSRQCTAIGGDKHVSRNIDLLQWFDDLSSRLRRVRVCCGDWSRVCGKAPTTRLGTTAVFLDPPYGDVGRAEIYTKESLSVAGDVRRWAIEHGDDPNMRIALCGYDGEHDMPDGWIVKAWMANGGYGSQSNKNKYRERIWFSPHCINLDDSKDQMSMF